MKFSTFLQNSTSKDFDILAKSVLSSKIIVCGHQYSFAEIEIYFWDKEHQDPFIHKDEHQKTSGKWYFHRANGKSYKDGTFKGMDLTFGHKDSYGGILVRSIVDDSTQELVEGSCNVIKKIMTHFPGISKMNEFVDIVKQNKKCNNVPITAFKSSPDDFMFIKESSEVVNFIKCPRVGLTLKHKGEDRNRFVMKQYRYINSTIAHKLKKFKAGIILSLIVLGTKIEDMKKFCNKKNIEKYVAAFNIGKSMNFSHFEGKNMNVENLCFLFGLACNKNYV
jgi:hypothetical protein